MTGPDLLTVKHLVKQDPLENTAILQGPSFQYPIALHPRDSSFLIKLESGFLVHKLTLMFAVLTLGFPCPSLLLSPCPLQGRSQSHSFLTRSYSQEPIAAHSPLFPREIS